MSGPTPNSAPNSMHQWRHFTPLNESYSLKLSRAQGCWVWDDNGDRYLDGISGLFCVNAGHSRPEIAHAVDLQMREAAYTPSWNASSPIVEECAAKLLELAPDGMSRVMFLNSGSEAVEAAIKLARQFYYDQGRPRKREIITRRGAYHGVTLGALSVTQIPALQDPFLRSSERALEIPESGAKDAIIEAERLISRVGSDQIAALVVEPIQNGGGCLCAAEGEMKNLQELTRSNDILLISDEVICSFGRIGEWFGSQRIGYQPDIVTVAKGLTSGHLPLSAMITSSRIARQFERDESVFLHGSTYGGHPAAVAAAMANIEIFERDDLCVRACDLESELGRILRGIESPLIREVRGAGFYWAVELDPELATSELIRNELTPSLYEERLICRAEDRDQPLLKIAPPLIAGDEEFELIERALLRSLRRTEHASARCRRL